MSISAQSARRLFEQMSADGIPLCLSVPFLIRVRGWQVQYFCRDLGIHRGYFNALLHGANTPSIGLRMTMRKSLGFDPWQPMAMKDMDDAGSSGRRANHGPASFSLEGI